jgi:hypothetical protein
MTDFILDEKGEEVISERHQKNFKPEEQEETNAAPAAAATTTSPKAFTDVSFDDI